MKLRVAAMAVMLGLASASASANGLGEDRAFQFKSPSETAVQNANTDLIERKRGGFYDSFRSTFITTNNVTECFLSTNCSGTGSTGNIGSTQSIGSQSQQVNTGTGSIAGSPTQTNSASPQTTTVPAVGTPLQ